jgi:hypothetical protein
MTITHELPYGSTKAQARAQEQRELPGTRGKPLQLLAFHATGPPKAYDHRGGAKQHQQRQADIQERFDPVEGGRGVLDSQRVVRLAWHLGHRSWGCRQDGAAGRHAGHTGPGDWSRARRQEPAGGKQQQQQGEHQPNQRAPTHSVSHAVTSPPASDPGCCDPRA